MQEREQKTLISINGRFLEQRISGVQRYGRELIQALDDLLEAGDPLIRPFAFEVLAPRGELVSPPTWKHIPLRQTGWGNGHSWEQLQLPRHMRGELLFCPGNTAPLQTLFSATPLVVTIHDLSWRYFPQAYSRPFRTFYGMLTPLILRRAEAIITVSKSEQQAICKHYPQSGKRIYPVQNGGLGRRFDPDLQLTQTRSATTLLYVGALNSRKNPQGVLAAFLQLAQKRPLQLLIAGSGGQSFRDGGYDLDEEALQQITFLGQIDNTRELIRHYKEATCLVFPSFYEASPLPPIEAMACGCPVIASAISSLRERCGDAALFCDADSAGSIAEAVEQLLDSVELQQTLRADGHQQAARYTWENCVRETLEIISTTLKGRHIVV